MEIPRRAYVNKMTEAEKAIRDVIHLVEAVGADVRLTDAVCLLGAAQDAVADYVDGIERRRLVEIIDGLDAFVDSERPV